MRKIDLSLLGIGIGLMISLLLTCSKPVYAQMVPNSAKECAICHFRWLDQFFMEGRGTDLVEYQPERDAAGEMICYSCHNGIVCDSRERFWAKRGHRVNMKPSDKIKIPPTMPLDENGLVVCGTCHTAHGVSDELRYQQTIYLRCQSRNSEICIQCHVDKSGGPQTGNHPIGVNTLPIPTRILDNYGRAGVKKDSIICETCHTVHGTTDKNLLVIPTKTGKEYTPLLCESCHTPNPSIRGKGIGGGTHPVDVVSQLKLPSKWSDGSPLITGVQGEVICLTCHSPHQAKEETSILVKGGSSPLCLECHKQENLISKTKHDLTLSAPSELDLTSKVGLQTGICSACHRPHNAEKYRLWSRPLTGLKGDAGSQMCESCHQARSCARKKLVGAFSHPVNREMTKVTRVKEFPGYDASARPFEQGKIMCATCHNPHLWDSRKKQAGPGEMIEGDLSNSFLRMANNENSDFCLACHQAQNTVLKTDHDLRITAGDEVNSLSQLSTQAGPCSACHVVHNAQGDKIWARLLPQDEDQVSSYCKSCHREKNNAEKKLVGVHTHPVGADIQTVGGKTTMPLFDKKGIVSSQGKLVTCSTCHNVHQWKPGQKGQGTGKNLEGDGKDSFLRLANDYDSTLCLDCHKNKQYIAKTDHDLRFISPNEKNIFDETPKKSGLCSTCHVAHNGSSILMFAKKLPDKGSDVANQLCISCHKDKECGQKKVITNHTHPMDKGIQAADGHTTLPLYTPDGMKQPGGKVACASCHNVHQWSPTELAVGTGKEQEGTAHDSFLRLSMFPDPILCGDCHQNECKVLNSDHDLRLTAKTDKNLQNQTVLEGGVCSACHLVHNAPTDNMWARELPQAQGSPTTMECTSCHSQGKVGDKKIITDFSHPVDIRPSEKEITTGLPLYTMNGEKVETLNNGLLTCNTCHNPHQWAPDKQDINKQDNTAGSPEETLNGATNLKVIKKKEVLIKNPEGDINNSFLRLTEDKSMNLCTDCHKDKQYICKSEHDFTMLSINEANLQGRTVEQSGVCSACHVVHNGPMKSLLWARQLPGEKDFMLGTCLSCHEKGKCAEKKTAFIGLHPSSFVYTGKITQFRRMGNMDYQTYFPLYDKQGKKSPIGFVTCPTCHNVHQWDPKVKEYPDGGKNIEGDPRNSFLRNSGADFSICLDCHNFEAILRYKNYHVPSEWQPKYWRPGQEGFKK